MRRESSQIIRSKSQISYDYMTIKMTQSRLSKGLIAIPVPLAKWFPKRSGSIHVYLDNSPVLQPKTFSSYESSTRECRIGGVKDWFKENGIKSGDEIVIQVIDKENFIYRLIPEQKFIKETRELQLSLDNSESEREASEKLTTLAQWTSLDKKQVVYNEYKRLVDTITAQDREHVEKRPSRARETTPASLRTLLETIYQGHCQLCDFWFLKRDNSPYFEIHHLNPPQGHHPKNLVVVCGNCHNQFEHANVGHEFNNDSWLIRVLFNERIYQVNQIALNIRWEDSAKALFI